MNDYRTDAIGSEFVPVDPFRCPRCKGQSLTLKGNIIRGFEERSQDGKVVSQMLEEEPARETTGIDCHDCKICWQIMSLVEVALSQRNLVLEETLFFHQYPQATRISNAIH